MGRATGALIAVLAPVLVACGSGDLPGPDRADAGDLCADSCDSPDAGDAGALDAGRPDADPAVCDPFDNTGCVAPLACYVVSLSGPSCNAEGQTPEGDDCMAGNACEPGLFCVPTPGIGCRPLCDSQHPCAEGVCNPHPSGYGYCN